MIPSIPTRPGRAPSPSARRRPAAVAAAALTLGVLLLGGCRSTERAAAPATPATGSVSDAAAAGDPLAGIEATVDAIDREVAADAAVPDVADPGAGTRARR